jgi:hypothetical protein
MIDRVILFPNNFGVVIPNEGPVGMKCPENGVGLYELQPMQRWWSMDHGVFLALL